ncbi:MAG: hypothetical protein AAF078_04570 [Planctomycetota bacterium]
MGRRWLMHGGRSVGGGFAAAIAVGLVAPGAWGAGVVTRPSFQFDWVGGPGLMEWTDNQGGVNPVTGWSESLSSFSPTTFFPA